MLTCDYSWCCFDVVSPITPRYTFGSCFVDGSFWEENRTLVGRCPNWAKPGQLCLLLAGQGAAFLSRTLPGSWPASNPDKKRLKTGTVSWLFCDLHEKSEMTSGLVLAHSRLPANRGRRKALVGRPKAGKTSIFLAAAPGRREGRQEQADTQKLASLPAALGL